jgi:hypothetical protein
MTVNWLMIEILDADGEVTYRNSFITDMPVNRENVAELAACGRARWKIENEGNRGKSVGNPSFFPCVDSARSTLCIMCRRHPTFPT